MWGPPVYVKKCLLCLFTSHKSIVHLALKIGLFWSFVNKQKRYFLTLIIFNSQFFLITNKLHNLKLLVNKLGLLKLTLFKLSYDGCPREINELLIKYTTMCIIDERKEKKRIEIVTEIEIHCSYIGGDLYHEL